MSTVGPDVEPPKPGEEEPPAEATVLRMLLGTQLRRLRETAGIAADGAGYAASPSHRVHPSLR